MSDEELQLFTEKMADCILYGWNINLSALLVRLIREKSLVKTTATMISIPGNALVKEFDPALLPKTFTPTQIHAAFAILDSPAMKDIADLIEKRERLGLARLFLPWFRDLSVEQARALLALFEELPAKMRDSIPRTISLTKRKSGPAPKALPSHFPQLAARGTELEPLVFKIMELKSAGTKKSLRNILDFFKDDFPEAYEYLKSNIVQLDAALNDKTLLARAKRATTRARAIADALAGAEVGYDLRTSYERVREARRMVKRSQG
jgi:hypothetical protein